MTTASETAARAYLEAQTDEHLRATVATAADRYLPVSAAHRADIDWNGRVAAEILAGRAAA